MLETTTRPVAPETVSPIKPSEALRLGRLIRPEYCTGHLFEGTTQACALGAIAIGYGWTPRDVGRHALAADGAAIAYVEDHASSLLVSDVWMAFDGAVADGRDADAAALAWLAARGL